MRGRRRVPVALLVVAGVLALLPPASAEVSDTIAIVKEDEADVATGEVAARLSEETFASAGTVLIGRDDEFADAMASGLLQADSPLLLVPPAGPVPPRVLERLEELQPTTVVLLGGEQAISEDVRGDLEDAGYDVERTFGATRFETATAIAERAAPDPDTVLIARAFGDDAADPSQAFADALAAGGWAADQRWPILLTQTDELPATTREWLADRDVDTAYVLGGTAAVSAGVEAELADLVGSVERVAGGDRFSTAVEVAKERGADGADDVAHVVVVEGQDEDAWAGGFAAAGHSAAYDAPIVLTSGDDLPPATVEFLTGGGAFAQEVIEQPEVRLTCVTPFEVCMEVRRLMGLPRLVDIGFDPPSGSAVEQGDQVVVTVEGDHESFAVDGDCLAGAVEAEGSVAVRISAATDCQLVVRVVLSSGAVQDEVAVYSVTPVEEPTEEPTDPTDPPPTSGIVLLTAPIERQAAEPDLRTVAPDGEPLGPVVPCDCRDLRLSPDRSAAVLVEAVGEDTFSSLTIRRAPAFAEPVVLRAARDFVFYDDPQWTPAMDAVVVTRTTFDFIEGVEQVDVVRVDVATGEESVVATDRRLGGPDAVGPTTLASSGVGALVTTLEPDTSSPSLQQDVLAVVELVDVEDPLSTPVSVFQSIADPALGASLSPDGRYAAVSELGADRLWVTGVTADAGPDSLPADVGDTVWLDATTVAGVDEAGGPEGGTPNELRAAVAESDGFVVLTPAAGAEVPGLSAPGRPGVLGGHLLAEVDDGLLVRAHTGAVIASFDGRLIRDPQVFPL
jgi:putative cell wall-binding protein